MSLLSATNFGKARPHFWENLWIVDSPVQRIEVQKMCGAAGAQYLERQENSSAVAGFLPRRCTTVKSHSEPVLPFRHLPPFLSRDGERPRSGALSGSFWASFWRLSAALMRFAFSSSKCGDGHESPFGHQPVKYSGHHRISIGV